ncbi:hypothetical protein AB4511_26740, partial [Vibrio sp. 10N.222.54.F6]
EQLIAAVKLVSLEDVQALFVELAAEDKLARVVVQLRGTEFKDAKFADFNQQKKVVSIDEFHQQKL